MVARLFLAVSESNFNRYMANSKCICDRPLLFDEPVISLDNGPHTKWRHIECYVDAKGVPLIYD